MFLIRKNIPKAEFVLNTFNKFKENFAYCYKIIGHQLRKKTLNLQHLVAATYVAGCLTTTS